MSLWRQLIRGARSLARRSHVDRDVADEVQHYLDQATAAHVARGLSHGDATRAARLELGGATRVFEQVRGSGWESFVHTVTTDVRYAIRRLRGAPGFTAITVLTLALGVGGTTAIFSVVNPILFEPLPYPAADRVMAISEMNRDGSRNAGTFGMYRGLAERSRSFDAIAVLRSWQPTLTGRAQPERLEGQRVTASYFRVLGVTPVLGRDFEASDDRLGGTKAVILSDALWRRRFAADRAVLGRGVTLDDDAYTVIGVLPPNFENVMAPPAELWTPLQYDMSQGRAWGHHLATIGRLGPGISAEQATREIDALAADVLREQKPETYGSEVRLVATALHEDVTRAVRPALLAILAAVSLVLVIACVNVTNLLLARGVQRRGEFALRAALGAERHRLVRQLLTESLLLSLIGGVVGMAVAIAGVRALVAMSPVGLPRVAAIGVDGSVFAFALGVTTLIGLAFGLVPALQAARSDPHQALQHGSRRMAGAHRRTRSALVVAEVALALVLLVTSGLLLRSLERLFAVSIGFDSSALLTMQIQVSGQRFRDDSTADRFFSQALEAVRRVPGVTGAALTSQLPLSGDRDEYGVRFEPGPDGFSTFRYAVSPGYLETMRIPLRSGRVLDDRDGSGAPLVALINESFARRRFPAGDALGKRITVGPTGPYEIVGVVGDVRQMSLALSEPDAVYMSGAQWPFTDNAMSLVVRSRATVAPPYLSAAVRQAVWSVDKDQPVVRVATMRELLAESAAERRFALVLFEAFALAALILAAAGIYGVISGSVAERTREIGMRTALGASRANILGLVVKQGMTLTMLGAMIGLVGAVAATQSIGAMLFGVSRLDPLTYISVFGLLGAVSVIACGLPAWRASRVDPAITLRAD